MTLWNNILPCCGALLMGIASAVTLPQPARADSGAFIFGEVITVPACPKILVVAERNGFSIVQQVSGPLVQDRDVLDGNLETVGSADAMIVSRNNTPIRVIVITSLLSRTQYNSQITRYCNG